MYSRLPYEHRNEVPKTFKTPNLPTQILGIIISWINQDTYFFISQNERMHIYVTQSDLTYAYNILEYAKKS